MPKLRLKVTKKAASRTNGSRRTTVRKAPKAVPAAQIKKAEFGYFRSLLEGLRDETVREIDTLTDSMEPEVTPVGDTPDEPVGSMQTVLMINRQRKLLHSLEAALSRIDQGTYGRCSSCGNPIERRRLEILPDTTKCVKCGRGE